MDLSAPGIGFYKRVGPNGPPTPETEGLPPAISNGTTILWWLPASSSLPESPSGGVSASGAVGAASLGLVYNMRLADRFLFLLALCATARVIPAGGFRGGPKAGQCLGKYLARSTWTNGARRKRSFRWKGTVQSKIVLHDMPSALIARLVDLD
jgi:hypothetical protein